MGGRANCCNLAFVVALSCFAWVVSASEPTEVSGVQTADERCQPRQLPVSTVAPKPVDFDTEVVPVLTKAGCNVGACHGSASGRGGFRLSLFGGRPQDDYKAIVQEFSGRRVNLAQPANSLVLQKPTGMLDHGGEVRLEWQGVDHKLIERWISEGAPRLERTKLVNFSVKPNSAVVKNADEPARLQAIAEFSDGTERDVTAWTVFTATDSASVEIKIHSNTRVVGGDGKPAEESISQTVRAIVRRPGQHIVIARYLDRVVPIELIQPIGHSTMDRDGKSATNLVDRYVRQKQSRLGLWSSPDADDATFLRRITLDLTGRLPTGEQVDAFSLSRRRNGSTTARVELIDQLLESDEFSEYWAYRFSRLLRIRSAPRETQGADAYANWLCAVIANGTSLKEMTRELLLSEGDTHVNGPANFYRVGADARLQAEYASELLMGARMRCANCHNHPLDRWTQDDYHGLAAIFAKMSTGRMVQPNPRGEVTHPATGEPAVMRIPGQEFVPPGSDGRQHLADWLFADDNAYFGRAWVNRLWKSMMGRGLVEPSDDLRATNPPSHPALLDALAEDFTANGYDIRHTLRLIAKSQAYAASRAPPDVDDLVLKFYVFATAKPLPAEVLADAVSDVTGVWTGYGQHKAGVRAVTILDGAIAAPQLDVLGRCQRAEACETIDVAAQRGLASKLHFLNGDWINKRLIAPDGRLQQLIAKDATTESIVRSIYRHAFSRDPSSAEQEYWQKTIKAAGPAERQAVLQDFAWSILNSRAFTHNY
ncbi:MAG: DUF1549 and DUF1553 domain-containing protein [Pirellulales bacterium]|nr:DUF1549 and DUF1553 domain-containing protein [Pirellulales bacterium]